jgi:histidinol-phosphate phosphatase family protein
VRPAVFLDRDGTVIADREYLASPEGVALLPGAGEAVARLNRAGLPVVLVTNQSGIGRGYFSAADYHAVHGRLVEALAAEGARLDAVYHCPHAPEEACDCRKPGPGMFERAARELGLDLAASFYVGDRLRDVEAGLALGGTGILVGDRVPGEAPPAGVAAVPGLSEAVQRILAQGVD